VSCSYVNNVMGVMQCDTRVRLHPLRLAVFTMMCLSFNFANVYSKLQTFTCNTVVNNKTHMV